MLEFLVILPSSFDSDKTLKVYMVGLGSYYTVLYAYFS
jgi:hypothetical protein